MTQPSAKALQSSLSKLQISQESKQVPISKKPQPADSWEDEAENSSDTETEAQSTPRTLGGRLQNAPAPPPPTPSSPSFLTPSTFTDSPYQTFFPSGSDGAAYGSNPSSVLSSPSKRDGALEKRPEKTTTVASRLIAAGIGQKAPKRTEEQRKYDQAMKVQERKKRDQTKEEQQQKVRNKEKAMKDVWGD